MANFVLVHGAFHGGWCWRRVADILAARGHRVFTPTLTGLADRSHLLNPAINLDTHITDIVNVLHWEELEDVILCGHSYGGMVITGVADRVPERVSALVYLDAYLPKNGQSVWDTLPDQGESVPNWRNLEPGAPLSPASPDFFGLTGADADWVARMMTPQPAQTISQKIELTDAYKRIPKKLYVLVASDHYGPFPAFTELFEQLSTDPSWTVVDMRSGHDMMIEEPDETARILLTMA